MWISSRHSISDIGQSQHRITGAALGALGESRRDDLPTQFHISDDVVVTRSDITLHTEVHLGRRRRRRNTIQSTRNVVDVAPRHSCDVIPDPPVWTDYGGVPYVPSYDLPPGPSSHIPEGPSSFPSSQSPFHAVHTPYEMHRPSATDASDLPSSSSQVPHASDTHDFMGFAHFATPTTNIFPSFQSPYQPPMHQVNAPVDAHNDIEEQPLRRNPRRERRHPRCGTE